MTQTLRNAEQQHLDKVEKGKDVQERCLRAELVKLLSARGISECCIIFLVTQPLPIWKK